MLRILIAQASRAVASLFISERLIAIKRNKRLASLNGYNSQEDLNMDFTKVDELKALLARCVRIKEGQRA
jgi:hypothetical protein